MRLQQKEKIAATLATSNFGGIGILSLDGEIIYTKRAGDALKTCLVLRDKVQSVSLNTIYYTTAGRAYVRKFGVRYYLDEFMRVRY